MQTLMHLADCQCLKKRLTTATAGLPCSVPSEPVVELEPLSARKDDSEGSLPSVMDITQQPPSSTPQDLPPVPETKAQPDSEAQVVR